MVRPVTGDPSARWVPGFGGAKRWGKVLVEGWRRQIWGGGRQVVRVEFRGGRAGLCFTLALLVRSVGWTLEAGKDAPLGER